MNKTRRNIVVAACFLMIFTTLGFCSSNKGLYLSAITEALGIRRSLFSINDSIRFIVTAVVNLFFGSIIAKLGPKKMVAAGFVSLILSVYLYSAANTIGVFYIGGALLGLGLSWTGTSVVGYIVGRWCPDSRGTVMGAILCANGFGGALAAQIVTPIIYQEGNPFGYRNAYHLVMAILAVSGVLIVLAIRDTGEKQDGPYKKHRKRGRQWTGIPFEEAKKKPYFYMTVASVFLVGMVLQSVNGVGAAHMRDVGIDPAFVATVWSVHSLVLAAAKFLTGILYDKKGMRITALTCQSMAVLAIIVMIANGPTPAGRACAMAYGIISSFALPLETIMVPLIASDLFGEKAFARIMGILLAFNTAGYAVGSPLTNLVYDKTGSYLPMFYVLIVLMLAVIVLFQIALSRANAVHAAVTAQAREDTAD